VGKNQVMQGVNQSPWATIARKERSKVGHRQEDKKRPENKEHMLQRKQKKKGKGVSE
jgi:hypothetical protein